MKTKSYRLMFHSNGESVELKQKQRLPGARESLMKKFKKFLGIIHGI